MADIITGTISLGGGASRGCSSELYSVEHPQPKNVLGTAKTDETGEFRIKYRRTKLVRELRAKFPTGGPDLYLKIYDPEGKLIHVTPALKGSRRFVEQRIAIRAPTNHEPDRRVIVSGSVSFETADAVPEGVRVALFDAGSVNGAPVAVTNVNDGGLFEFELNALRLGRSPVGTPELYLGILHRGRPVHSTRDSLVFRPEPGANLVDVTLPDRLARVLRPERYPLPTTPVRRLIAASGIDGADLDDVEGKFARAGITDFETFAKRQATLAAKDVGLDDRGLARVRAIAKFTLVTGSPDLSEKLVENDIDSLVGLASMPFGRLAETLKLEKPAERQRLDQLYRKAVSTRNHAQHQAAAAIRAEARDLAGADNRKDACLTCEPCDSVFSPVAYLFDLLDLVYHHWGLTTNELEELLLQEIDELHCDAGLELVLQIELAIEVLQSYLSRQGIGFSTASIKSACLAPWLRLLDIDESDLDGVRPPASADAARATRAERLALLFEKDLDLDLLREIHALLRVERGRRPDASLADLSVVYADATGQFAFLLSTTYAEVLERFRAELIGRSNEKTAGKLQARLFIDLTSGACITSNRVTQLIQSLQALVLSVRTGEIRALERSDLSLPVETMLAYPVEEAGWQWMKDYSTWASAMYAMIYTENVLPPPIALQDPSSSFEDAVTALLAPGISPYGVRKAYLDFLALESFRDAADLDVRQVMLENLNDMAAFESKEWLRRAHALANLIAQASTDDAHRVLEGPLYFPLLAAWALNRSGDFAAAHDWYRQLYDPEAGEGERPPFDFEEHFSDTVVRQEDWFTGSLDPHGIASRRKDVYLRHAILMTVRNLIDWADHEYALATAVSIDRARTLYDLAAKTLDTPELGNPCRRRLDDLKLDIVLTYSRQMGVDVDGLHSALDDLSAVRNPDLFRSTLDQAEALIEEDPGTIDPLRRLIATALANDRAQASPARIGGAYRRGRQAMRRYEDEVVFGGEADGGLASYYSIAPGLPDGPFPGGGPGTGGDPDVTTYEEVPVLKTAEFCVPANPLVAAYGTYISMSLLKLQLCLDIAGEPLPAEALSGDTADAFVQAVNDQAAAELNVATVALGATDQPRYRYAFLVEKARQYGEAAQRLGSALLTAHEKRDAEAFRRLQARQAIELAGATVGLKQLGLGAAQQGLQIAHLQEQRAETHATFWNDRIADGFLSKAEFRSIELMNWSARAQILATAAYGSSIFPAVISAGLGGLITGAGVGTALTAYGAAPGAVTTGTGVMMVLGSAAALSAMASTVGQTAQSLAGVLSTYGNISLTWAGFERRWEEWNLQRDLSEFDARIAHLQKDVAHRQAQIADQDLSIAKLSRTHAREVLDFLEGKFSNEELYHWMVTVLQQNYRSLMQTATATARMAQRALEFERQERLAIIQDDYWSLDASGAPFRGASDAQRSAGLLGSERLTTDLTKLDAFKITTDKRRLQLRKTISLAQMLPRELVRLRSTGEIHFNTLLDWFDRDFPGHYLRLIKSVNVSVLALVPPVQGIHATLGNSGVSSVVVKEGFDTFTKKRSLRTFAERVALDAPYGDTGLFVLNHSDPMLLPFEGLGVETEWIFELPRRHNALDFDTIADVLFTIEYTALHDPVYEQQLRASSPTTMTADVIVDARSFFPDEWYHFMNPLPHDDDGLHRTLGVDVTEPFLPSQLKRDGLKIRHATVMVEGDFSELDDADRARLLESVTLGKGTTVFTSDTPGASEIAFQSKDVTDRSFALSSRPQASPAAPIGATVEPVGEWELEFTTNLQNSDRTLFERMTNVVLVLTIEGDVIE